MGSEDDNDGVAVVAQAITGGDGNEAEETFIRVISCSELIAPPSPPSESLRNAFGTSRRLLRPAIRSDERMGSSEAQTSPISSGNAACCIELPRTLGAARRGADPARTIAKVKPMHSRWTGPKCSTIRTA